MNQNQTPFTDNLDKNRWEVFYFKKKKKKVENFP